MRRVSGIQDVEDVALDDVVVRGPRQMRRDAFRLHRTAPQRGTAQDDAPGTWTRDVGPVLAELVLETFFGRVGDGFDRA